MKYLTTAILYWSLIFSVQASEYWLDENTNEVIKLYESGNGFYVQLPLAFDSSKDLKRVSFVFVKANNSELIFTIEGRRYRTKVDIKNQIIEFPSPLKGKAGKFQRIKAVDAKQLIGIWQGKIEDPDENLTTHVTADYSENYVTVRMLELDNSAKTYNYQTYTNMPYKWSYNLYVTECENTESRYAYALINQNKNTKGQPQLLLKDDYEITRYTKTNDPTLPSPPSGYSQSKKPSITSGCES
ncbi:hypothetical protein [Thalassotalea agarivorans]|uniref:Uncharacterized protein n=1 Tax=Thalassotalea agarivorans TaxID=349064 RepID=A0A1I0GR06_THASX|nr:hypothetical protein [Thalassotalea agarivorans]SET72741.1 hypothetical protein SAMN05660429_02528 [Thalassotalea agarivorans]